MPSFSRPLRSGRGRRRRRMGPPGPRVARAGEAPPVKQIQKWIKMDKNGQILSCSPRRRSAADETDENANGTDKNARKAVFLREQMCLVRRVGPLLRWSVRRERIWAAQGSARKRMGRRGGLGRAGWRAGHPAGGVGPTGSPASARPFHTRNMFDVRTASRPVVRPPRVSTGTGRPARPAGGM